MAIEETCYQEVEGESLEQGDLIKNCPIFIPDYPDTLIEQLSKTGIVAIDEISGEAKSYNVVLMSQTCDLENGKLSTVIMCPYWSLEEFGNMGQDFKSPKTLEDIRRGNRPSYYMLDAYNVEEWKLTEQIVDFRTVYSVPYRFLKTFSVLQGKRLRLRSPYKEELSQAFGKFIMRVARPKGIRKFT